MFCQENQFLHFTAQKFQSNFQWETILCTKAGNQLEDTDRGMNTNRIREKERLLVPRPPILVYKLVQEHGSTKQELALDITITE